MNRLEIIVNSCDAYEDVWAPFFYALRANWEGEIPPIVLNTERKTYTLDGLRIRHPPTPASGNGSRDDWGGRLLKALECVDADYVLMTFDDHIVEGPIDIVEIARCVERLKKESDICAFYLVNPFLPLVDAAEDPRFAQVRPGADYILNSAPGVWRKADLMRFVRPGDNAWAWEYFGSTRLHACRKKAFAAKDGCPPVLPYQHALGGAIYRGKWVARVIEPALEKYGLRLDLSVRGTIEPKPIPHSLGWQLRFLATGFRMTGFGAARLVTRALLRKFSRLFVR